MAYILILNIIFLAFLTLKLYNMPTKAEFQAALDRQNTAISNIADDIRRLTEQIGNGGLSEADEADVLAQLSARADALEALAAQTPEEPTEPPVEPEQPQA